MWRAFFFAVGIMLIILGLECLVTEQFVVSDGTRFRAIVSGALDGEQKAPRPQPAISSAQPQIATGFESRQGRSQFGPSRFDRSPFDAQNQSGSSYYGGVPRSNSRNANSQFSLAGFGTPTQPAIAPLPRPRAVPASSGSTRVMRPKEWMPWSLLAAGTLIVLYTNSTSGRYSND
jgi:hypothetical protein